MSKKEEIIYKTYYESPLGRLTLLSDGESLTGLYIKESPRGVLDESLEIFKEVSSWLDLYFYEKKEGPRPRLKIQGTDFQKEVWESLMEIDFGQIKTYGKLAEDLGRTKKFSQAVGQAVGRNPISIIIPCHRILGAGGKLTGFRGGMENKKLLLEIEGVLEKETE